MKTKHYVIAQVVFLLGAVIAGALLKVDLADGPRMAHRLLGTLAVLASLVSFAVLLRKKAPKTQAGLAALTLALSVAAGIAGKSLKTASDYATSFNIMKASGVLALACAVILLTIVSKDSAES